jgi:hypothetical protein
MGCGVGDQHNANKKKKKKKNSNGWPNFTNFKGICVKIRPISRLLLFLSNGSFELYGLKIGHLAQVALADNVLSSGSNITMCNNEGWGWEATTNPPPSKKKHSETSLRRSEA